MILLDPDLEPHPAPRNIVVSPRAVRPRAATVSWRLRIPSRPTLNRFLAIAQEAVNLRGEVTVLLTTDAAIRKLNRQFRGKNEPTDVISFPAEGSFPAQGVGAEKLAGDLAISVETARRQAADQGHALTCELKVLILHGLLHLAGHDHEADNGKMACRERLLRARLGLPQGLIERAEAPKPSVSKRTTKASSKSTVLKGHGFSRAVKSPPNAAALAAEGSSIVGEVIPQGLKPGIPVDGISTRLKSCSFKAKAKVKKP